MSYDSLLSSVRFSADGLVPAIAQCEDSGDVLMMAWMSSESLRLTLESGEVHYWSRSRKCLWRKGESSGHIQRLSSLYLDCDGDTILLRVHQSGAACHTGARCCFFRRYDDERKLWSEIE